MIEYISGTLDQLTPTYAVIDTNGVGYLLNISLFTFSALQESDKAKLYVHEAIREDAYQLYGFADLQEREMFRHLIGVSGVGASTARIILSALSVAELQTVIATDNHKALTAVKGVGSKTAQRIIVDLKDKIKTADSTLNIQVSSVADSMEEALLALVMLGFAKPQVAKVLKKIYESDPALKSEEAIKKALSML